MTSQVDLTLHKTMHLIPNLKIDYLCYINGELTVTNTWREEEKENSNIIADEVSG